MTTLATRPRAASDRRTADTLLHGPAHSPAVLPRGEEIARRARTEQGREELRRVRSLAAVIAVACVEAAACIAVGRTFTTSVTPLMFSPSR